jgi:hypothetical protein
LLAQHHTANGCPQPAREDCQTLLYSPRLRYSGNATFLTKMVSPGRKPSASGSASSELPVKLAAAASDEHAAAAAD